ncbi:MAG: hypothetical protein ACRYGL_12490 [Janthinobacterium lividum]
MFIGPLLMPVQIGIEQDGQRFLDTRDDEIPVRKFASGEEADGVGSLPVKVSVSRGFMDFVR